MDDPCDRFYLAKGESIKELHGASISEDADGLYRISVKKAVGVEVGFRMIRKEFGLDSVSKNEEKLGIFE